MPCGVDSDQQSDLLVASKMVPVEFIRPMITDGSEVSRKTLKVSVGSTTPSAIVCTIRHTSRVVFVSVRIANPDS